MGFVVVEKYDGLPHHKLVTPERTSCLARWERKREVDRVSVRGGENYRTRLACSLSTLHPPFWFLVCGWAPCLDGKLQAAFAMSEADSELSYSCSLKLCQYRIRVVDPRFPSFWWYLVFFRHHKVEQIPRVDGRFSTLSTCPFWAPLVLEMCSVSGEKTKAEF